MIILKVTKRQTFTVSSDSILSTTLSQTSFLKGSYLCFVYNLRIYKQLYIFLSYLHVITQSTIQICNS